MRIWLYNPASSRVKKITAGKGRDSWLVSTVEGTPTLILGKDLPPEGPADGDIIGLGYWPGMKKTPDLIPAFQVVREATSTLRRPEHLEYHLDLVRALRFWRARHPISDATETQLPTVPELRAYVTNPAGRTKHKWEEVAKHLHMSKKVLSYVRREVREFRSRLRDVFPDYEELHELVARVEETMPDGRARRKRKRPS